MCPPKIKHFLWQLLSGCIAVLENLKARAIQGIICCVRCGTPEESINHVFFKCPPACTGVGTFKDTIESSSLPSQFSFCKYKSSFWRVSPKMEDHQFAWILWYIWKGRNNNFFSNLDVDPRDTLKLTELESTLWVEAHVTSNQRVANQVQEIVVPTIPGR